jgi:hypothetical protein
MRAEYAFSQRRACGLMTMAVSSYRYQSRRSDEPLRTRLVELAREKPRFGYRRLNQEWALDFLHDAVECGRPIRVLSVADAYTREVWPWKWTRTSPVGE